ncbi:MAG TPA: hypothetical protein GXX17_00385 [Clostridiales bacterium]|nr:hypothetical protein [Clostridiales bacterium]
MLCEKCGKNQATTHIHKVINGVAWDMNLCSYCAYQSGYGDFGNLDITNMLGFLLNENLNAAPRVNRQERCSCCNSTFADIAQSGMVGCSYCYKVFYNQLLPSIQRIHGKVRHEGKRPKNLKVRIKENKNDLEELRKQLETAVKQEDYETAAKLRDKIREIEGRGNNNG